MKELIKELTELRDTIQKFGLVDECILMHKAITALQASEWIEQGKFKTKEGEDFLIKFESGEVRRFYEDNLPREVFTHCKKF